MSHVPRNVSFWLLMQDEETKQAIEDNDEVGFKKILFEKWGVDTEDSYEIVSCPHRPVENNPFVFNGPMVQASERLDPKWVQSDGATWLAKVESIQDAAMRADLKTMGKTGSSDKTFTNKEIGKRVAQQERKKGV